jgi:hypothetical protein
MDLQPASSCPLTLCRRKSWPLLVRLHWVLKPLVVVLRLVLPL